MYVVHCHAERNGRLDFKSLTSHLLPAIGLGEDINRSPHPPATLKYNEKTRLF